MEPTPPETLTNASSRSTLVLDLGWSGALFLVGVLLGTLYCSRVLRAPNPPWFYQSYFGPAVMFSCGRGFVNPDETRGTACPLPAGMRVDAPPSLDIGAPSCRNCTPVNPCREDAKDQLGCVPLWIASPTPALGSFLRQEVDQLDCRDLPKTLFTQQLDPFHQYYRYLLLAVGLTWRLVGISWSGLAPLFGVLYGAAIASTYGIFRLVMPRIAALLATVVLTVSPLHLDFLPYLRDYAKAPFVLTLVLIMGHLLTRPLKPLRSSALAAAAGTVLGIGLGFRPDLMSSALIFVIVIGLFLPGSLLSNLRVKLGALLLLLTCFIVTARPILSGYASGHNLWHIALVGLMPEHDPELGVAGTVYQLGYISSDENSIGDVFIASSVNSFADRILGFSTFIPVSSKEYARAGARYFREIARTFPADLLIRVYASVLKVLELPFHPLPLTAEVSLPNSWARYFTLSASVLSELAGAGFLAAIATFLLLAARSPRDAMLFLLLLLYFGGYPAIQFQARHYFYLGFISYCTLWFAVSGGLGFGAALFTYSRGRRSARNTEKRPQNNAIIRRWFAVSTCAIVLLAGPLLALRRYQDSRVAELIARYAEAEREPLALNRVGLRDERLLVAPEGLQPPPDKFVSAEYLLANFAASDECDAMRLMMTIRYQPSATFDLSHSVSVDLSGGSRSVLFPAYYKPRLGLGFEGIEIASADARCLTGLYRTKHPEAFPLLLILNLSDQWRESTLHQTLAGWEPRRKDGPDFETYTFPPRLRVTRKTVTPPSEAPELRPTYVAPSVEVRTGGQFVQQGRTEGAFSCLVQLGSEWMEGGSSFVARGELHRGGLTIGLLKAEHWAGQATIQEKGKFAAVVQAPEPGVYSLVIANALADGGHKNDFTIDHAWWNDVGPRFPVLSSPPDLRLTRSLVAPPERPDRLDVSYRADLVQLTGTNGLGGKGQPESPSSYLLRLKGQWVESGSSFVARGALRRGGITIGLVKDGRWDRQVTVRDTGQFTAIVQPAESGVYTVVIANALTDGARENDFVVDQAWWNDAGPRFSVYSSPPDLQVTRDLLGPPEHPGALDVSYRADLVQLTGPNRFVGKGRPETPESYLVRLKDQWVEGGSSFVVRGVLHSGGVTIGLVKDGRWDRQVTVRDPGPFAAVVQAPASAVYAVVIANALTDGAPGNDVVIDQAWWNDSGPRFPVYSSPPDLQVTRDLLGLPEHPAALDVSYRAELVQLTGPNGFVGKGRPETPESYLVRLKDQWVEGGSSFVVRGVLHSGGVTIGLVKDGRWDRQVTVRDPGPFAAVVQAPASAVYAVVIANAVASDAHNNEFVVEDAWWAL